MSTQNNSNDTQDNLSNTITIDGKARYYEPAPAHIDLNAFRQVIESRRSVRKFSDKPIPKAVLDDCLDMALLAPNSSNLQPWTFYVVRSADKKAQLVKACMSQLAAKTAAELIVCVARTDRLDEMAANNLKHWPTPQIPKPAKQYYSLIAYNYKAGFLNTLGAAKKVAFTVARQFTPLPVTAFSQADAKLWAAKSTALACENFVLALRAHGFDSCMMEGFDEPRIRKLLQLQDKAFPIMVIAAGERALDGVFWPQVRFDRELFIQEI
jgi:nitroreductase